MDLKAFLQQHKVKASFVGGALVVSTAYGSCQLVAPVDEPAPIEDAAPAEEEEAVESESAEEPAEDEEASEDEEAVEEE